jgi:hypothetical protein
VQVTVVAVVFHRQLPAVEVVAGCVSPLPWPRDLNVSVIVRFDAPDLPVFAAVMVYAVACPFATGWGFDVTVTVMTRAARVALAGIAGPNEKPVSMAGRVNSRASLPIREAARRRGDRWRLGTGIVITDFAPLSSPVP